MSRRLHLLPRSPRALKILAVVGHLGLDVTVRALDYDRAEHLEVDFQRLNPNRRQPVLEDGPLVLWESNAILIHLAQEAAPCELWPSRRELQTEVLRWLFWESSHCDSAWDILITERLKKQYFTVSRSGRRTAGRSEAPVLEDPVRVVEGEQELEELLTVLLNHLKGSTWLAARFPTIADFAIAAWLPAAHILGLRIDRYDQVSAWRDRVMLLDGWRAALAGASASS